MKSVHYGWDRKIFECFVWFCLHTALLGVDQPEDIRAAHIVRHCLKRRTPAGFYPSCDDLVPIRAFTLLLHHSC